MVHLAISGGEISCETSAKTLCQPVLVADAAFVSCHGPGASAGQSFRRASLKSAGLGETLCFCHVLLVSFGEFHLLALQQGSTSSL